MTHTVYGTSYFPTTSAARSYYRAQYPDPITASAAVARKVREGEIHIGLPPLKANETFILIDGGKRYGVVAQ